MQELREQLAEREHAVARESDGRAAAEFQLAELSAVVDTLNDQLQEASQNRAAVQDELARAEAELAERCAVVDALNDQLQEASQSHAAMQQELARAEAELAEIRPLTDRLEATESELSECARLLEKVSSGLEDAKLQLGERDYDADPSRHLVFMPAEGVYSLAELPGPAPKSGADASVDGVGYRVSRVGPSPLPDDRRRCAYLEVTPSDLVPEVPPAGEDHHGAG